MTGNGAGPPTGLKAISWILLAVGADQSIECLRNDGRVPLTLSEIRFPLPGVAHHTGLGTFSYLPEQETCPR